MSLAGPKGAAAAATGTSTRIERLSSRIATFPRPTPIAACTESLNREALAAAAGALGVGIVEHEAGREIVLAPVHDRADEVQHRSAVDIEIAAGSFDLLV